ncbi:MAG TPA: 2-C-methyl-D-erythritol 4-phosphate cytidylyltransferase [Desulfobacterales bacterium]|nr:2-C-methyl-D-erythritol 4-phosphate cytidylyltransferase [Desulfobacterales bacterium]
MDKSKIVKPQSATGVAAVILAAGQGTRMGTDARKQYMMLGNRPVLAHTLLAFEKCDAVEEVFLVVRRDDDPFCQEKIIDPLGPDKPIHLVSGGATRQESVYNGLKAIDGRFGLVVIHDGVRLLINIARIAECIMVAREYGGCILGVAASDTIKTVDEHDRVVVTMKRHMIRMAQTPQAFHYNLILEAHVASQKKGYVGTDDAELVEQRGGVVKVIPGDPHNIKITTPTDLKLAEAFLALDFR